MKSVKGPTAKKEVQLQNRKAKCLAAKLTAPLDLNKVKALAGQPQSSPVLLVQSVAFLLADFNEKKSRDHEGLSFLG